MRVDDTVGDICKDLPEVAVADAQDDGAPPGPPVRQVPQAAAALVFRAVVGAEDRDQHDLPHQKRHARGADGSVGEAVDAVACNASLADVLSGGVSDELAGG